MNKIITKYKGNQAELIKIVQRIIERLENNPDYPTPPAALAELKKVFPEFMSAYGAAEGGDKKMVSIKNDKKVIILGLVQQLNEYVTATSKGDRTLLLSSGFDVTSEKGMGAKQPPSIKTLQVEQTVPGEVTARIRNVKGIKAYIFQYTTELPGANTIWLHGGSSLGSYTFKGLTGDKRHWFRVMAIGFNGQTGYSPIVSKLID